MRIRSHFPYWIEKKPTHFTHARPISNDLHCDVAIVGGGVSGALIVHHLAKKGVNVVLLDRRQPGSNSTAACTALIQYELDQPLTEIAKIHSLEHAQQAYRVCVQALEWLVEHVNSLDDMCDINIRPSLLIAKKKRDCAAMQEEATARIQTGIPVRWLEREEMRAEYKVDRLGGIESQRSIELDPLRLTIATLNAAVVSGARVYTPAEVVEYDFQTSGVSLRLAHGPVVRAKKVVVANGYETPPFLRKQYGRLLSTWAVASEPVDLSRFWPQRQLVWEWGSAYLYARTTPDNRLIFGGGDRRFTNAVLRDALIPTKTAWLTRQVKRLVPGMQLQPAYAWAGTFAETKDGMPYIGAHEDCPNTYLALGYGGNGVTFSLLAARIITGILCDDAQLRAPAWIFDFNRG